MPIDEYAQWAAGVAKPGTSRDERLIYLILSLLGEAGEAADNIKNLIRDRALNEDYLIYELGDLIYYWISLCLELGQQPSDLLGKSRANIEQRLAARAQRPIPSPTPGP
jgi:NTP pyrophosphatase (non-canonical NTP hydrolase)